MASAKRCVSAGATLPLHHCATSWFAAVACADAVAEEAEEADVRTEDEEEYVDGAADKKQSLLSSKITRINSNVCKLQH